MERVVLVLRACELEPEEEEEEEEDVEDERRRLRRPPPPAIGINPMDAACACTDSNVGQGVS